MTKEELKAYEEQLIEEINSEIPKIHELFDIAYEYNKEDSTRTELSQKCTTYLLDVWQTMSAIVDNFSSPFKGMTNGEVIQAVFDVMVLTVKDGKVWVERIFFPFDEEWWNAPYQKGGE